jgi:Alpha/beta hydrolase
VNITTARTDVIDDYASRLTGHIRELERCLYLFRAHPQPGAHASVRSSQVHALIERLEQHAHSARRVAEMYEERERVLVSFAEQASSVVMWNLGRLLPTLIVQAGPAIVGGVAIVLTLYAARRLVPGGAFDGFVSSLQIRLPDQGQITSHPLFVAGTAHVVAGADDFLAGALGLPQPGKLSPFAGQEAVAAGVIATAATLTRTHLTETPITVQRHSIEREEGVTNYEDLVSRIPRAQEEAPQIRIEHYRDSDTYVVYLGGTIDPGTDPSTEPWDMTSNLSAMAQMDAGSYRATHEAMRQAGIDAQDNVIMVGHSQGGLVAALIAQSGEFQVRDVVTVGAPIRHIELPPEVHVVALEHREDVIPSLSGVDAVGTTTHTVVTRSVFAHTPPPQGQVLPAHNLSRYIDTAALLDKNAHGEARTTQERIATLTRGDATVTMWRARRLSG